MEEEDMNAKSISEGKILWEPTDDIKRRANISKYLKWLESEKGLSFNDYNSLWEWSVKEIESFWQSLWQFFDIKASKPYTSILSQRKMPGAKWFEGAELNYAEHSSNAGGVFGLCRHRGHLVQLFT